MSNGYAGPPLSQGALRALVHGPPQPNYTMVLQVIDVKEIQAAGGGSGPPRFRLIVSDGVNTQQAILGTQLNELVSSNVVVPLAVVYVEECAPSWPLSRSPSHHPSRPSPPRSRLLTPAHLSSGASATACRTRSASEPPRSLPREGNSAARKLGT